MFLFAIHCSQKDKFGYICQYLNHDGSGRRSFRGQILHVTAAVVLKLCTTCLVLSIPLNDVVPVEVILIRIGVSDRQKIPSLFHLLYEDVPSSFWYENQVLVT